MFYFKLVLLLGGLGVLALLPNPLDVPLPVLIALWISILAALLVFLLLRLGRSRSRELIGFMIVTAALWSIIAALRCIGQVPEGGRSVWFLKNGPLKALRFSSCMAYAAIVIASIAPAELLGAKLLPRSARVFLMIFRAFVPRLEELITSGFDQLISVGLPRQRGLLLSIVQLNIPFPTHEVFRMNRWRRICTTLSALISVLTFWFQRIITTEVAEMAANVERLLDGEKGE